MNEMNINTTEERIQKLDAKNEQAFMGGGEDRIKKHKARDSIDARERLDVLLDPGSFVGARSFCHPSKHQLRNGKDQDPWRRSGHRLRPGEWKAGLRVLPRLHCVWWIDVSNTSQ